ncbi:MAG TPA: sensor domain-containing diguanylate cyclase [Burkholderiales bacterium]|nr:sensor domain-containing diguanylate cyclase [Burkholderiales bacterium]
MSSQPFAPDAVTRAKQRVPMLLLGAVLALAGVGIVEALLMTGAAPLTPIGWPSLGMIAAAGIGGVAGLAGGAATVLGYYVLNLGQTERFQDFFAHPGITASWGVAVALLAGAALAVRPRLMRLASAEDELVTRRKYELALRESEERLRVAKARLEMALDGSNVALWDFECASGRVYLSDAWARTMGAAEGETVTTLTELISLVHRDDLEQVHRAAVEALKGERALYAVEHRVRARNGEWHWVLSRGRVTDRDPASGRALRMIGTNVDITERKRIEEAVHSAAQSDPLTGLANRLLFNDRLRLALARSRRSRTDIAVLYLDLDGFKKVNDTLGHAAGDRVLKDVALRLRACLRQSDAVARFGGDEFVVLLEDLRDREHAVAVVEKIIDEMRRPLRIEGSEVAVTASVGLAYGDGGDDGEALLKRADQALYDAKAGGRDRYSVI